MLEPILWSTLSDRVCTRVSLPQAGVATCRWAVEYEQAAADAFKLNNPEANVFCNNCNVLLRVSE
jgi:hypothetical protein